MNNLSHKIRLYPTKEQEIAFKKACGVARFSWNWALAEWNRQYSLGLKPNGAKLRKEFNSIKEEKFPWVYESLKTANQEPFRNLQKAFGRFFKKIAKHPKFKKKGQRDSFYISNDPQFRVFSRKANLPRIGEVRLSQPLRLRGKIMSGTVSRASDKWFLSVSMEVSELPRKVKSSNKTTGIDLGIKTCIVTSDGKESFAPKPLKKFSKTLSRKSRQLSKKKLGSSNCQKSSLQLSKLHGKISNVRNDWIHKETTKIIDENQVIKLENLNVSGMLRNRKLSKSVSDVSFYEIRRQLEYKAKLYGREVVIIDRFFPSSKTCSDCGCVKKELKLSERMFDCQDCGFSIDRDLNAAINIKEFVND